MKPIPKPGPISYCDLFFLGSEGFFKVIVLLKKGFYSTQRVSQVLIFQEGLQNTERHTCAVPHWCKTCLWNISETRTKEGGEGVGEQGGN